jgi:hypothetical protein
MYALETNATAEHIVRRSFVCHPSTFAESLRSTAAMHTRYAGECRNALAASIARNMALTLNAAAYHVETGDIDSLIEAVNGSTDWRVQVTSIAAKLQCLTRDTLVTAIG